MTKQILIGYEGTFLKTSDLQKIFSCCRNTIGNLCKNELIPKPLKIGGTNYYLRESLEQYIKLASQQLSDDELRLKIKLMMN